MNEAREYAGLFRTGQYGCLYIVSGSHARGNTFFIQLLPLGEEAKGNGETNLCLNGNAVLIYGIIGGNPGWTEEYGWIRRGPWEADFAKLVESFRLAAKAKREEQEAKSQSVEDEREKREAKLLEAYGGIHYAAD